MQYLQADVGFRGQMQPFRCIGEHLIPPFPIALHPFECSATTIPGQLVCCSTRRSSLSMPCMKQCWASSAGAQRGDVFEKEPLCLSHLAERHALGRIPESISMHLRRCGERLKRSKERADHRRGIGLRTWRIWVESARRQCRFSSLDTLRAIKHQTKHLHSSAEL